MSWCKGRLWPQLMRLKLVRGNVNRVTLHCQCHHLRAAKPALTALLSKPPEAKHLKQMINSLIKLAQTKQASPAVSVNHIIERFGVFWFVGWWEVFVCFLFLRQLLDIILKLWLKRNWGKISSWGIVVEHKALMRRCTEKGTEMKQENGCWRCVE